MVKDIRTGGESSAPRSLTAVGSLLYFTADDGFHAITMDFGEGCIAIHGHLTLGGERGLVRSGRREVLERHDGTGAPTRVALELVDDHDRRVRAEGRCLNRLGVHLNPNLFTWNCLTEWTFEGVTAHGEDHDNWSAPAARRFFRSHLFGA